MKRSIVLALALLLGWSATAGAEVKVVTTLTDFAAITREVGGDRVEVESIVKGSQDPHYVEILPSYMLLLKRADLFVQAGLDLELWAPQVVDGARNRNLRIVDCSRDIDLLEVPTTSVNASMGDIHVSGNPHYWLDPANGARIARAIADGLESVDPEGYAYYEERLADFESRLQAKVEEWRGLMEPYAGAEIVYFHNAWPYFNHAFGLEAAGFVEPKPGVSPSPGHTADVIRMIGAKGIRVIAIAPQYDRRVPDSIARQTGAAVVVLASSVGGVEDTGDYFALFDENLRRLREALGSR